MFSFWVPHPKKYIEVLQCVQITSNRTGGNDLRLHQRRFALGIKKDFFTKRVVNLVQAAQEGGQSPSLEAFKRDVDVALRDLAVLG